LNTIAGVGAPKAAVAPGGTVHLQVTDRGGVPTSGVSAVVLNVAVVAPTSAGYITVYGAGSGRPTASNLNFVKGQTVPNLVVAPVGAGGVVDLYNGSNGTVQLVADVAGYFLSGTPEVAGAFGSLAPSRLLNTIAGVGAPKVAVAAGGTVRLQVTGRGGVPATGVSAVVLNVATVAPTSAGYITVFGDGTNRPTASNLNFVKGQTVPNLVIAPVGANGIVDLYNGSIGTVQLVADVSGYFLSGTPTEPGALGSLAPSRLLNTLAGVGAPKVAVAAGGKVRLQVTGRGGVPPTGLSAVLNVAVVAPTSAGYITVFGAGTNRPTASNLNFVKGQTVPNLVIAPVGANGMVDLYNGSSGTVQLVADVSGYFLSGASIQYSFGDGMHPIGASLPAGTYRTRANTPNCYWERLSGLSGGPDDVISGWFSDFHQVVTIAATDAGFYSEGCGTWTSNLSMITTSQTAPFGSGTFIVGTDIGAGTWSAPGGAECYWERSRGFSAEFADAIDYDFGTVTPTVTILATDVGFNSDVCGTWTKQ
jgi:hypothetical protein